MASLGKTGVDEMLLQVEKKYNKASKKKMKKGSERESHDDGDEEESDEGEAKGEKKRSENEVYCVEVEAGAMPSQKALEAVAKADKPYRFIIEAATQEGALLMKKKLLAQFMSEK
jgi:hypothetical protein